MARWPGPGERQARAAAGGIVGVGGSSSGVGGNTNLGGAVGTGGSKPGDGGPLERAAPSLSMAGPLERAAPNLSTADLSEPGVPTLLTADLSERVAPNQWMVDQAERAAHKLMRTSTRPPTLLPRPMDPWMLPKTLRLRSMLRASMAVRAAAITSLVVGSSCSEGGCCVPNANNQLRCVGNGTSCGTRIGGVCSTGACAGTDGGTCGAAGGDCCSRTGGGQICTAGGLTCGAGRCVARHVHLLRWAGRAVLPAHDGQHESLHGGQYDLLGRRRRQSWNLRHLRRLRPGLLWRRRWR
jgi:hypothetical protein